LESGERNLEAGRLTHRHLLENCLAGLAIKYTPVALWRHFPVNDQSPESLAQATLDFQRQFDFDLVKVTPASSFCLKDWGSIDEWQGNLEGTREYVRRVIDQPEDWISLKVLDPHKGALADQLTCLKLVCEELRPEVPVLQTIFSPLSQAKNLVGGQKLLVHLRKYPDMVLAGLKTIAETTGRFIEEACKLNIAGIFYAVQHASYQLLTIDEYIKFGQHDDNTLIKITEGKWLNMLHLHGVDIMYELFSSFPVQVINWHDRETFPDIEQGQKLYPGTVCGGLQRNHTMVLGTPEAVKSEALDAIQATNNRRFILGTGCVMPTITPSANINAAIQICRR
jgi:uroporphyrinogen decarboxylase